MTSTFTGFCDVLIDDLVTNVPALRDVLVHRYAPYDPEQQVAEAGERHLAVFPAAEAPDTAEPLTTDGGSALVQVYRIAYWEHASDESIRAIADELAASELLALVEAIRARLYDRDNVFLGGAEMVRYIGTGLPERSSSVRWFLIGVQVRTSITLS